MSTIEADDRLIELSQRLSLVRGARKDLENEEAELRAEILTAMEDNAADLALTASGSPVVTVTTQTRRTINRPKLEAMYPEVFESVVEEKPTTMVKVHDLPY